MRFISSPTFVICSSVENCASWPMYSALSVGCMGSWCWSCATSSFRKSSLPSETFSFGAAAVFVAAAAVAPGGSVVVIGAGGGGVVAIVVTGALLRSGSGEDVDEAVAAVEPTGPAQRLLVLAVVGTGAGLAVGRRTALSVAVGLCRRAAVRPTDVDVERLNVQPLRLESGTELGRRAEQRIARCGGVDEDGGGDAAGVLAQVDADLAELGGPQDDAGLGLLVADRDADRLGRPLGQLVEPRLVLDGRSGSRSLRGLDALDVRRRLRVCGRGVRRRLRGGGLRGRLGGGLLLRGRDGRSRRRLRVGLRLRGRSRRGLRVGLRRLRGRCVRRLGLRGGVVGSGLRGRVAGGLL